MIKKGYRRKSYKVEPINRVLRVSVSILFKIHQKI